MSLQDELVMIGAPGTGQDINDPVWPSAPVQPDATSEAIDREHGHELRTLHGPLDLLQHVEEEIIDHIEHQNPRDLDKRFLPSPDKVLPIIAALADSWRGVTFTVVQNSLRIVSARDDRTRVIVTNQSNAAIWLSHEAIAFGSPGAIALPANMSREFRTHGEIWASPNVLGTPQAVDVQDEYGVPRWL